MDQRVAFRVDRGLLTLLVILPFPVGFLFDNHVAGFATAGVLGATYVLWMLWTI